MEKLVHSRRWAKSTKDGRILVLSKLEGKSISELNSQEKLHKDIIKKINDLFDNEKFEDEKDEAKELIKILEKKNKLLKEEIDKLGDEKFYRIEKRYYKWKKDIFDYFSSRNPEALEIVYHSKDDSKGDRCISIIKDMQKDLIKLKKFQNLNEEQVGFLKNLFDYEGYPMDQALWSSLNSTSQPLMKEEIKEKKFGYPLFWCISPVSSNTKFFEKSYCGYYGPYENPNITKEHFVLVDYELFNIDRTFYSNSSKFMKNLRELCMYTESFHIRHPIDPKFIKFIKKKFITETEKYLRKIELLKRSKIKGAKKIENIGYVYVLSNEAYPNIYKIGSTYGLPEERAEELTGTGHLSPFKVVGKIKVQSAEYYEKSIHKLLNKFRVKQGREFFKLDLPKIKECLKQVSNISEKGSKKITLAKMQKEIKF